jgi:prepilin peptidase CpaA
MFNIVVPASLILLLLGAALISDCRSRKIPNRLILTGLALAMIWQLFGPSGRWAFDPVAPGAVGPLGAIAAFAALLVAFFPFFALRIMGAGDVKLIAVIGAVFGMSLDQWTHLPGLALFILATGGALALLRIAFSRNASMVASNLRIILGGYSARVAGIPGPVFDPRVDSADRMQYAIAIAGGTTFYAVGKWSGWLQTL